MSKIPSIELFLQRGILARTNLPKDQTPMETFVGLKTFFDAAVIKRYIEEIMFEYAQIVREQSVLWALDERLERTNDVKIEIKGDKAEQDALLRSRLDKR